MHRRIPARYRPFALIAAASLLWTYNSLAQSPDEIRKAFSDLREDQIKYNCSRATSWLYQHRDALRDQILEELYRTNDPQARDSLLIVLFNTNSFNPDERFGRLVVQRLREEDTRVYKYFLLALSEAAESTQDNLDGAHHVAWVFVDRHYALFEPLLEAEIETTNDMWELWGIAWMMKKHNMLGAKSSLFTPAVLSRAATALKNDNLGYNATEAIRLFFMLPKQSLPILQSIANSSDPQQRYLARAWIDALHGNKNGFGYLNSKVNPYRGLLPNSDRPQPEWLSQVTEPYLNRESYP